ncbi:AAA family ATPase [Clostridium kluyveri]|uniref:endopeptidase La n=1 Tax=Clostridium kluyveri TaxID=1534 RepID=A0A1L5F6C5_CLOKL|nr:AAA family ATPase [Clostridium kluyveri]APM38565.1 ATP-dependent protease [Clostridium kluyveri]UZQ50864.1 AAA family ATPase [Clostridium kluyveri]
MDRELSKEKIIYNFKLYDIDFAHQDKHDISKTFKFIPEYKEVYEKINMALKINKEGYNIYLIDDFSGDKLENIMEFIKSTMENKNPLQDICYVVVKDVKKPKVLFLTSGKGRELKVMLRKVQKKYFECTYEFYNGSSHREKEILVEELQKERSKLINEIVEISNKEGFTLKITENGFNFIPLKQNGEMMNENEYEILGMKEKENIIDKVNILKNSSEEILDKLKNIELDQIEKIKFIINSYYEKETEDIKKEYLKLFKEDNEALEFLNQACSNIENEIKDIYSISYEDDKENISRIIYRYSVNVLVDNSENKEPPIIFEEDPNVNNLLGSVEYENINGTYTTGVNLIRPGSLLKANGGCLILRVSSLLNNKSAYYYFKKSIISGKIDLNYDRGYLELLSLSGLKPEPIKFNEKIILIGDYNTYDLLYSYDEDFKKIFKIRVEYNALLNINKETKISFLGKVFSICRSNKLHDVDEEGIKELAKFLSRKAEDRDKLFMDDYELERILMISDNRVIKDGRKIITGTDIINTAYEEELIEKRMMDMYRAGQIFIDITGKVVGQINGLSVINTGYFNFGKPIKITCTCLKGNGDVIDVQKESDLSGKIHNKAINILKGYIKRLTGGYDKFSVDFYLSFEQVYGQIDGDSASVAEVISMISSLSKIGIRQNIAVTGSINQFGEIQPIGGVNEKIEGFFKICKILGGTKGKGVLIPNSNIKSLALKNPVEKEIEKGNFHIYCMSNLKDAVEILMERDYNTVIHTAKRELKKYSSNR